jgi:hypothetical protein
MLPEGHHEHGPAAHPSQRVSSVIAELTEVMRAEVRQLVMFPITPDVFHRIEFRGIGRQVVQRQAAPLAGDKLPDQVAAMSLGALPDYQQSARQMTQQVREKVHHLRGADGRSLGKAENKSSTT